MGVAMLALARYTLKGPYQAAAVVGLLAILAVLLPPMSGYSSLPMILAFVLTIVAAILVGLIILTQGMASGVKVIVTSLIGISVVTWILLDSPQQAIKIALIYWLPIMILAQALRASNSLAMMLIAGIGLGLAGVLLQLWNWSALESTWIAQFAQSGGSELVHESLGQVEQLVTLLMLLTMPSLYLLTTLVIMAARWTQGRLGDSEAFDAEFQRLQFGRSIALGALIVVPVCFWLKQYWMISLGLLVVIAFMYQGIAVVHNRMARKKLPTALFVMFYLVLIMFSQFTVVLTAITGVIDNWLDLRSLNKQAN